MKYSRKIKLSYFHNKWLREYAATVHQSPRRVLRAALDDFTRAPASQVKAWAQDELDRLCPGNDLKVKLAYGLEIYDHDGYRVLAFLPDVDSEQGLMEERVREIAGENLRMFQDRADEESAD